MIGVKNIILVVCLKDTCQNYLAFILSKQATGLIAFPVCYIHTLDYCNIQAKELFYGKKLQHFVKIFAKFFFG